MDKKKWMVVSDIIRGLITCALAACYAGGRITPQLLVLFTILNSLVEAFRIPAGMAVLPKILEEKYYTYGTSLNSTISTLAQLLGMGAAGAIIAVFGIDAAIFIDALTFAGSGLILSFLHIKEENLMKVKWEVKGYFHALKEGIVYLKNQPVIRNFCLMAVFINAAVVPMNALQSPLADEVMGQGSAMLSVLGISLTVGMGAGAFLYPYINQRIPVRRLLVLCGCATGISLYLYTLGSFLKENVPAVYALCILVSFSLGIAISIFSAVLNVQFMKAVRQDYLARVGSIFNAGASAALPVTSAAVGALASVCTVSQIFVAGAVVCVLLFIYIALRKVRFDSEE